MSMLDLAVEEMVLRADADDLARAQRRPRGRPRSSNRKIKTLSLPAQMWEWLELWHPGNPSEQALELLIRAMKMWPGGPSTCPAMRPEKIAEHAAACRALRAQ